MGLTKSVQPYCRLAIITMQMMPKISWPQRVDSEAIARDEIVSVVTVSSIPALLIRGARFASQSLIAMRSTMPSHVQRILHRWFEQGQRVERRMPGITTGRHGTRCRTLCAAQYSRRTALVRWLGTPSMFCDPGRGIRTPHQPSSQAHQL